MNTLLLTGFAPFRQRARNGSQTLVEACAAIEIAGWQIETAILPVRWGIVETQLPLLIEQHQPVLVLSVGEGKPERVAFETLARNRRDGADVDGVLPPNLDFGAELPSRAMTFAAEPTWFARDDVVISDDAGAYLCNNLMFRLAEYPHIRAGFVHVPPQGDTPDDEYIALYQPIIAEVLRRNCAALEERKG